MGCIVDMVSKYLATDDDTKVEEFLNSDFNRQGIDQLLELVIKEIVDSHTNRLVDCEYRAPSYISGKIDALLLLLAWIENRFYDLRPQSPSRRDTNADTRELDVPIDADTRGLNVIDRVWDHITGLEEHVCRLENKVNELKKSYLGVARRVSALEAVRRGLVSTIDTKLCNNSDQIKASAARLMGGAIDRICSDLPTNKITREFDPLSTVKDPYCKGKW